jgi:hypothetical protein
MGLDQMAYTKTEDGEQELASWRKHPNLQGFMEALWEEKGRPNFDPETMGGTFGDFNCVPLELDEEDIDQLEAAIMEGGLPETAGFFFGDDSDDYYTQQDLEFVANARLALAEGKAVIYDSWW